MKKVFQFNKTFSSIFRSYILVFLLPLVVGIIIYLLLVAELRDEVTKAHRVSLEQARVSTEMQTEAITGIATGMMANLRVQSLYYVNEEKFKPINRYTCVEIQRDMRSLMLSNSLIECVDIYYINGDFFIGNMGRTESFRVEKIALSRYGLSYAQLKELSSIIGVHSFVVTNVDGVNKLLVIERLSTENGTMALLFIRVDAHRLTESFSQLAHIGSDSDNTYIETKQGYRYSADFSSLNELVDISYEDKKSDGIYRENIRGGGEDNIVVRVDSELLDWRFVISTPEREFFYRTNYVLYILYIYVLFCLIFGIFLVVLMSRKQYAPLHKLVSMLRKRGETVDENDYSFLENAINTMVSQENNLEKNLDCSKVALRTFYLNQLLNGQVDSIPLLDPDEFYGVKFSSDMFAVIYFEITDTGEFFHEDENSESDELLMYALENVAIETMEDLSKEFVRCDEGIICIASAENDLCIRLEKAATFICTAFSQLLDVNLAYAVGGEHHGLEGISVSYREAVNNFKSRSDMQYADTTSRTAKTTTESVSEYISSHFNDPSLSLSNIAEYFELNSSYLSHMFKKHTGIGVLEFLQRVRIMEAKRLLSNTNISISEIAELTGFYSARTFSITFKKYENMPPSVYRADLQK